MEPITINATVIGRAWADVHKDAEGKPAKLSAHENVRLTLSSPSLTPPEISFHVPVLGAEEMLQGTSVTIMVAAVEPTSDTPARTKKKK